MLRVLSAKKLIDRTMMLPDNFQLA